VKPDWRDRLFPFADIAGLRTIALFEAFKATLVLVAGFGVLFFLNHDLQRTVMEMVHALRLDPASRIPSRAIALASQIAGFNFRWITVAAVVYAAIRYAEAWGMWFDKAWGNWIGALSGLIYLPFEAYEIVERVTVLRVSLIVVNIAIIAFLMWHLRHKHNMRAKAAEAAQVGLTP